MMWDTAGHNIPNTTRFSTSWKTAGGSKRCLRLPVSSFLLGWYCVTSVNLEDTERGATTLEADEALVYRKMVKQSKQVIVAADSSKLGKVSPAFICPSSEIHILITDTGATKESLVEFERQGTRILLV